ncbi:MAG: sphinganine-1-phosphate aldolase [Gammaproteobacteria bacterium]|jgi:sphinganine-1-phosphate aldolase
MRIDMPQQGLPSEELFAQMEEARAHDVAWRDGRLGLYVHFGGEDVLAVAKQAYQRFFSENALGRSAFPSLVKFENEVVGWTASLLGAGADATGNISSGGTESIFLAMKSIRDWANANGRGGACPEVVAPYSAHPAFSKAAQLLRMQVTRVRLGDDFRVDLEAMREAIGPHTVGLVGSSPGFPHGVVDPISAIAGYAREHDLWLHVDACVGGFVLPFARGLQYPVPDFDFSVDGVRSMSADLHKYGFAAKGASTIIYRSREEHSFQPFEFDDWPRGHYAVPTFAGTRPGGAVAAAWAVMRYLGEDGYTRIVRSIMHTRDAIMRGIETIDELHVISNPEGPIVTYGSHDLDIFAVAQAMSERGWFVTRGAQPPCIHLGMLTAIHVPIVDRYIGDLVESVAEVRRGRRVKSTSEVSYGG